MRSVVLMFMTMLHLALPGMALAQNPDLSEFLPSAVSIGNGVMVTNEGARSLEDIAGTFADPADAQARLTGWGWNEQTFRYFGASDPVASLTSLEVSLHRFSSIPNAAAALPYFLDARAAALGIRETPVALDRAQARGIAGAVAEGQEATIYVLLDTILARVTAISATGDPLPYAEMASQFVVDQSFTVSAAVPDVRPAATLAPTASARAQNAGCTLVELRPGYPGYRGFVTGLFGPGQAACLEELQRRDPAFDRAAEDTANAAAAARIGLSGAPSDWVWENWMAIEAERGMFPACYTAARLQMENAALFQQVVLPSDDIRLQVGSQYPSDLVDRTAFALDVPFYAVEKIYPHDELLRAVGWVMTGLREPNAHEIQQGILEAAEFPFKSADEGGGVFMIRGLIEVQGGYAPVPPTACAEDQIYIATVTFLADHWTTPPDIFSAFLGQFEQNVKLWQVSDRSQSLAEFLAEK